MELTYEQAIQNVSKYIDGGYGTAFEGSTALAIVFNLPKEKTMADLVTYRLSKQQITHIGLPRKHETLCGLKSTDADVRTAHYKDKPTCPECLKIAKGRQEAQK